MHLPMNPKASLSLARPLQQPGAPDRARRESVCSARAQHLRVLLAPGLSLHEALAAPLVALGLRGATIRVLGGVFARIHFCVPVQTPEGPAVAAYSAPRESGPSRLIFGNATFGLDLKGEACVHCHGAFCDDQGRLLGGHLLPQDCIVGPEPLSAFVTVLPGATWQTVRDAETTVPLFIPHGALT
jgi:hypothetical protein